MNVIHQSPRQALPPDRQGQPEELPQFLNKPPQIRKPQAGPPPLGEYEGDDDVYTPFSIRMTEYLWPTMFWFLASFNVAILGLAVFDISQNGYNVWIHAQAVFVTILSVAVTAMITKWILNGPDGIPSRKRLLPLPTEDKT